MLTQEMISELRHLESLGGGKLHTKAVVVLAKKSSSALHKHPAFVWDIKKAAMQQWMDAARAVIQVYVGVIEDHGKNKMMRQYVNIIDAKEGPVYRSTQKVLIQNRKVIVDIVADRILSIIASYPLSEFDEVVNLVRRIRSNSTEGDEEAA